jgi:chromosome segregation ATPase
MSEANFDDLRTELSRLEAEEAKLSAIRERLQHQIDFGYASETTRAHEREVSDERQELHRRIDSIRARLGEPQKA